MCTPTSETQCFWGFSFTTKRGVDVHDKILKMCIEKGDHYNGKFRGKHQDHCISLKFTLELQEINTCETGGLPLSMIYSVPAGWR